MKRSVKRRKIIGETDGVLKGKLISNDNMKNFRERIFLLVLTDGCTMWTASEKDSSRIKAEEITFPRSDAGVSRVEGYSNSDVYGMMSVKETL